MLTVKFSRNVKSKTELVNNSLLLGHIYPILLDITFN